MVSFEHSQPTEIARVENGYAYMMSNITGTSTFGARETRSNAISFWIGTGWLHPALMSADTEWYLHDTKTRKPFRTTRTSTSACMAPNNGPDSATSVWGTWVRYRACTTLTYTCTTSSPVTAPVFCTMHTNDIGSCTRQSHCIAKSV